MENQDQSEFTSIMKDLEDLEVSIMSLQLWDEKSRLEPGFEGSILTK